MSRQLRRISLAWVLCLLSRSQTLAEKRVVVDAITDFGESQVVAAVKAAMEKLGCHVDVEKVHVWGQEIKCTVGEEKVTAQAATENFVGLSIDGQRLERRYTRLWIKTSGGKKIWSNILDKETNDILRSNDNIHDAARSADSGRVISHDNIHDAARNDDLGRVIDLLKGDPAAVSLEDVQGYTPLHWAALQGNYVVAALLLERGADVNARNREGQTSLHLAVTCKNIKVVALLLASKADVNAKDNQGRTPLRLAVAYGRYDVGELLREHGGHE